MKVPYLALVRQFNDPLLHRKIIEQFRRCQFVLGPEVDLFENHFARLCGVKYTLGVNSATDALFLALKALDIGPGDEVITVSNSFIASAGAIIAAGAKPVFVDVGTDYNMDPNLIEGAITPNTKAIMPVHLTGNPADMHRIGKVAKIHGLRIVEDAAQAINARIGKAPVGSLSDVGCFSLHPLKNLNVAGDGGALTTNSKMLYYRLKELRNHGLRNRDEIETFGYNSRLDAIQAIVARHTLERIEEINAARINNARFYDSLLADMDDNVLIPPRRTDVKQVFHTYVVRVKERQQLVDSLNCSGVETKIHYPIPIHLQKPCRKMGYKEGDLPETEKQSKEIISLPIHQYLTREQIGYVAHAIRKYYERK